MATLAKKSGKTAKGRGGFSRGVNRISDSAEWERSGARSAEALPINGLAGVSHELRNLLTALNLYSELLAEPGVLANPHCHMAEEIRLIANAGKSMLDRMNQLSMPASGMSQAGACDAPALDGGDAVEHGTGLAVEDQLASVLDSCLPILAHLAGPQVHVHLKCARNHGCLPISSEDLTLILVNLVRNAAEAMPRGGGVWIAIQPAVKRSQGHTKYTRIVVEDDGPGISVKARAHLFEGGYTTKKSLNKDQADARENHGLGLAIVRRQVESAGGVIQVRAASTRGGARFEIRIPFAAIQPATKVAGKRDHELQRTNFTDEGTRVRC